LLIFSWDTKLLVELFFLVIFTSVALYIVVFLFTAAPLFDSYFLAFIVMKMKNKSKYREKRTDPLRQKNGLSFEHLRLSSQTMGATDLCFATSFGGN